MSSHSLQKEIWVQVAPQKLSLCHEYHICTSTKKNKSISHLLLMQVLEQLITKFPKVKLNLIHWYYYHGSNLKITIEIVIHKEVGNTWLVRITHNL